jgi:TnpA family transposase
MQTARRLDDLALMFIKRMKRIHNKAQEALDAYRKEHQGRVDKLLSILQELLTVLEQPGTSDEKLAAMKSIVGERQQELIEECKAYAAYADNNYAPFLWKYYKSHRQTFFSLLEHVTLVGTSQDHSTEQAIVFVRQHRQSKADWLDASSLDLSWVPDKWWKLISGKTSKTKGATQVARRHFEVCVFSQLVLELKSGDLCIVGSDDFSDYRSQLISWDEYETGIATYCEQAGLPTNSVAFVEKARSWLETTAALTDKAFPDNQAVRIENGEPVLTKLEARNKAAGAESLERLIADSLVSISIVDALADTEHWLQWTHFFGPLSGFDAKIDRPRERYVATVFCYGCGLGPMQTARSLQFIDRRQIGWINQRHITEDKLDQAITKLINAYNRFALPKLWGSGKTASADGTKWDLYEQNLLSEYHIRYGGIGYYHVSDTYVALFSHFIPCGVWEAVYILDGLLNNKSDIQPDTLYADTQGQTTAVFGLAYLLGINLMPRIRNWKDLKLFKANKDTQYEHIDVLFSDSIDWGLIQTHLPDMLRVVLSIKAGRISASTLLRKLGTYSRKNKLYQAMSKLGRVVRTVFLLKYLSDAELRSTIQAATNKSEAFNGFVKWASFGNDATVVANDRDEQRKLIKYSHLVANCLIFHNVSSLTRVVQKLAAAGHAITDCVLARMSPYLTEHVNRFGNYTLTLDRACPLPDYQITVYDDEPKRVPAR